MAGRAPDSLGRRDPHPARTLERNAHGAGVGVRPAPDGRGGGRSGDERREPARRLQPPVLVPALRRLAERFPADVAPHGILVVQRLRGSLPPRAPAAWVEHRLRGGRFRRVLGRDARARRGGRTAGAGGMRAHRRRLAGRALGGEVAALSALGRGRVTLARCAPRAVARAPDCRRALATGRGPSKALSRPWREPDSSCRQRWSARGGGRSSARGTVSRRSRSRRARRSS